jgi:signal transduction histidine kinase/CheY-like chemotaxis protein
MKHSIRLQLYRLVLASVGVAFCVITLASFVQVLNAYVGGKRDALFTAAHVFATSSSASVAGRDENRTLQSLKAIGRLPGLIHAEAFDADGRTLAEIGRAVRLDGEIDMEDLEGAAGLLRLLQARSVAVEVPVIHAGERVGRLVVIADTHDLWSRTIPVVTAGLLAASLALLLALLVAGRLQRAITRPLLTLTDTMLAIERGHDYGQTVPESDTSEIGVLGRGFNRMLGEIRQRDDRLARHRERLEQDVAERTHDLALAKEAAEQANEAKSDFLSTMSHEIRTPLNGVLVMAELLAGSDLPQRQRRYADVIARSGQSLMAIINDILDFSKIEAGKLEFESVAIDPWDITDTVVSLFAEKARQKGLDLAAGISADLPARIAGDPVRLTQVISNLVNNAVKFTQSGHVLVQVSRVPDRPAMRFDVRDTGIGIAPEKIGSLFSAFTQADQSTTRQFGGTGLGLAICKRLVEGMGGEIGVESVVGEGSTFYFTLPIPEAEAHRATPPASLPDRVRIAVNGAATAGVLAEWLGNMFDEVAPGDMLVVDAAALVDAPVRPTARLIAAIAPIGDTSASRAIAMGHADMALRWPLTRPDLDRLRDAIRLGAPPPEDETQARTEATLPRFPGMRVLVVDDDAVNREVATEALAQLGVSADTAEGAEAGFAMLERESFDLVLMDGSMPGIDGFTAARIMRTREDMLGLPRQRIVAATAHVIGAAAEAWRDAGMDGVVHKPLTLAKLAEALSACPRITSSDTRPITPAAPLIEDSKPPVMPASQQMPSARDMTEAFVAASGSVAETPASLPGEGDLISTDHHAQLRQMGGAKADAFLARMVRLFIDRSPAPLAEIERIASDADASALASALHALKSMSWNIGAERLARHLENLEQMARAGDPAPDGLVHLRPLWEATIAALAPLTADPATAGESAAA